MKRKIVLVMMAVLALCSSLSARPEGDRFGRIRRDLDSLCVLDPRFGTPVDVSVTAFPVAELLKSLAIGNGLNLTLSLEKNRGQVTCNLEQVPIKDVLLLCCRECRLDLTVESGIVHISPYVEAPAPAALSVTRDSAGLFSYDIKGCTLVNNN